MSKKLNEIQLFFLENHKDKLSIPELASRLGCTTRTVYNHLNRLKGDGRTAEGRAEAKGELATQQEKPAQPQNPVTPTPPPADGSKPLPPPGLELVGRRRGAVVMTEAASEIGDEVFKGGVGKPPPRPDYLFVINPEKETR